MVSCNLIGYGYALRKGCEPLFLLTAAFLMRFRKNERYHKGEGVK